ALVVAGEVRRRHEQRIGVGVDHAHRLLDEVRNRSVVLDRLDDGRFGANNRVGGAAHPFEYLRDVVETLPGGAVLRGGDGHTADRAAVLQRVDVEFETLARVL